MKALLRKKKLPVQELPPTPRDAAEPWPTADNRLLLLIPEGSHTYRLAALPDVKNASMYVDAHLVSGQSFLAFWALDPDDRASRTGPGEALILVRDERRADVVQPYSFADLQGALSFLEAVSGPDLDGDRTLLFWVEPVSIPRGLTEPSVAATMAPAGQAQAPQNASSPPVSPASMAATPPQASPAATPGAEPIEPVRSGILSRMAAWPGWDGLGPLVVGAALGRQEAYYALDEDEDAAGRAALIITLGAISTAAGAMRLGLLAPTWYFAGAIVGWSLAATVTYMTATILFRGRRPENGRRRLQVALAFAYSPALLLFLGIVPVFGPLLLLAILIWIAGTSIIATTTVLELDMEVGFVATFAGWVVLFALTLLVPTIMI